MKHFLIKELLEMYGGAVHGILDDDTPRLVSVGGTRVTY